MATYPSRTVTGSDTVDAANDYLVYVNAASNTTLSLSQIYIVDDNQTIDNTDSALFFKRIDNNVLNTVTIVPFSGDTINNAANYTLLPQGTVEVCALHATDNWERLSFI